MAVVSYGIDDGHTETQVYSLPEFGQTSPGGTTYYHGSVNTGTGMVPYSGSTYTAPTYGVTGYSTQSENYTVYRRLISLQILDGKALDQQKIKPLYEGRLVSSGRCGSMPAIFGLLMDALFQKWPGANAYTQTVNVPAPNFKCEG